MTHDEARKAVEHIIEIAGDDEAAHSAEDKLYADFVHYVASQEGPHRAIAEEILRTENINFARWCA